MHIEIVTTFFMRRQSLLILIFFCKNTRIFHKTLMKFVYVQ